jgi:hypothetical protein
MQEDGMGEHKRFYDVDVNETDVEKITGLPTQFAFANGVYLKPQRAVDSIEEIGIAFLEKVRLMQDGEDGALGHHVGGAAVGGMRDIHRAQENPDLKIMSGDYAVIRNEKIEGQVFVPFQVAKIIEVYTNADDFITEILVHECGGPMPKGASGPCDHKQTYKPRYKGIDPTDKFEKDMFVAGYSQRKPWQKPVQCLVDPLTIIEWGKEHMIITKPSKLRCSVLTTIHDQPRVDWTMAPRHLKRVPIGGGRKRQVQEKAGGAKKKKK